MRYGVPDIDKVVTETMMESSIIVKSQNYKFKILSTNRVNK